jgi:hydrophobic/amphiphilic exporter-1 (mainly G- bacteria), HAE1 family
LNLTRLFVARPTLVFVLIALMSLSGVISIMTIVKQLFPNVDQPTVTISVQYNGASVTEMRDNIVAPIEQYLAGTTDLQTFSSVVEQGQASIQATFVITSDIATDLALVNKDVQTAEKVLPTNITPPTVSIRDPSESTVVTMAMYSQKLSPGELSLYAQNVIAPKIEQLPGISFANVGGVVTPAYEINVDPAKLAASGLTLDDVIATVGADNERVPGGTVYEANRQTTVDVRGDIQNIATIASLPIQQAAGGSSTATSGSTPGATATYADGLAGLPGSVDTWTASNAVRRIEDVANVISGYEPRQVYAQISGRPGLFLQIQKASDASEVDASNAVLAALPLIQQQFPSIEFKIINVQSKFTEQQIDLVVRTLLEAVLLTAIAMVFFLRSWRNALVVCVSIPTSLAIAFSAMKVLGFTLDTISLLAMSLVIGILVDDSTVVLENIERHFTELHQTSENAAIEGRAEIGAAAIVITFVDVVVFFPIAFIGGQVGRQLVEFAIVVVISTLTSLFVSFTVTPTLAGLWALKSHWKPPAFIDAFTNGFDSVRNWYAHRVLPWGLKNGVLVAAFCAVTFGIAIALVPLGVVGEEYIPTTDRGQIFMQLTYPIGAPLAHVRDEAFKVAHAVDKQIDVDAEATTAGGYSAAFGGFVVQSNVAQLTVFLKDNRKFTTTEWVPKLTKLAHQIAPDAVTVVVPSTGQTGGNKQPIDFIVSDVTGGDPTPYATKVLALLKKTPGATSVNSSGTQLAPEVSILFDRQKMQALDVSLGNAAEAAGAAFGGDVATQFETPAGLEQVQVIYPLSDQTALQQLAEVPVRSQNGSIVHLSDFARFSETPTSPLVTRTDRLNVIHVDANFAPSSSLSNVQSAFVAGLPGLHLPPNITVKPAPLGQQDFMNQTLRGLGSSLVLSILLVFLLMVALYNSYRDPFIIIFSVPVAAVGAMTALVLTHQTLNLFSLIGTILLVGIATKNGILLVDYANTLRGRGLGKLEAIKQSAFTRFRPIVMTSFSVIFGNLPLALALDPGSGSRASLGIVIIGGVLSSLVLTLLLIPNMYMWLAPKELPQSHVKPRTNGKSLPHSDPEPVGAH